MRTAPEHLYLLKVKCIFKLFINYFFSKTFETLIGYQIIHVTTYPEFIKIVRKKKKEKNKSKRLKNNA